MTKQYTRLEPTAAALGVSKHTVRAWVRRKIIPCYKPTTRLMLFDLIEVQAAIGKFRTGSR